MGINVDSIGSGSIAIGKRSKATEDCVTIGSNSGENLTTGRRNVIIGNNAANVSGIGVGNTCDNVIVIGFGAEPSAYNAANEITLGDGSIGLFRCNVQTITSLSDVRDKTNIQPLTSACAFIDALNPVSFDWNRRDGSMSGVSDTGFIAQELAAAEESTNTHVPGLVQLDNPDMYYASYGKLLPHLVQAVRELSAEVAELKARLNAL